MRTPHQAAWSCSESPDFSRSGPLDLPLVASRVGLASETPSGGSCRQPTAVAACPTRSPALSSRTIHALRAAGTGVPGNRTGGPDSDCADACHWPRKAQPKLPRKPFRRPARRGAGHAGAGSGLVPHAVDAQHSRIAIAREVEPRDQPLAGQDRHGVVAVHALGGGHEGLEAVVEAEQLCQPHALADQRVERRKKPRRVVEPRACGDTPPVEPRESRPRRTAEPLERHRRDLASLRGLRAPRPPPRPA